MFCSVVCCMLLWYAKTSTSFGAPNYNFSISNLYTHAGHWYAEKIQLDHEGKNIWNVILNYTRNDSKNSQSITIVDNNISSTSQLNSSLYEKQCSSYSGYQLLTGFGYYKVHYIGKPWLEALKTCEQEEAHLYIFNSNEEAEAVAALFAKIVGRTTYWLGVHDQFKEGHYVTIFSQIFKHPEYMKWFSNEHEHEDCGCVEYVGHVYGFGDHNCSYAHPFICEHETDFKC